MLDEPNAHLDPAGEQALLRSMSTAKRRGVTLLIISHRPSMLAAADKMVVLRDGAVETWGPRAEVMAKVAPAAAVSRIGSQRSRPEGRSI